MADETVQSWDGADTQEAKKIVWRTTVECSGPERPRQERNDLLTVLWHWQVMGTGQVDSFSRSKMVTSFKTASSRVCNIYGTGILFIVNLWTCTPFNCWYHLKPSCCKRPSSFWQFWCSSFWLLFQNTRLLSQFVSPHTGQIYGRQVTGLCLFMQKRISKLIKRSQFFGKEKVPC